MLEHKKEVLNLFGGIGGNRKLWKNVNVTTVEDNEIIAECYKDNFNDKIIKEDVLKYIVNINLNEFDFIWASPPCTTHTMWKMIRGYGIPDMTQLYGLITFLKYAGKDIRWIVENVRPWYKPLIKPNIKIGRHYFWCNFNIQEIEFDDIDIAPLSVNQINNWLGNFNIEKLKKLDQIERRQVLRNCVHPLIGNRIFKQAFEKSTLEEW